MEGGKREKHPSMGMISWSKVNSHPEAELFGSDIKHAHLIKVSIHGAEVEHHLNRDWYYEKETVASVYMSSAQFAEFMTTPNASGVPCTFDIRADVPGRLKYPGHLSVSEKAQIDLKESISEAMTRADDLAGLAKDLLEGSGTLKKADRKELLKAIIMLRQQVHRNLPFLSSSISEAIDKVVNHGKQELEAFAAETVRRHGLEALGVESSGKNLLLEGDDNEKDV